MKIYVLKSPLTVTNYIICYMLYIENAFRVHPTFSGVVVSDNDIQG